MALWLIVQRMAVNRNYPKMTQMLESPHKDFKANLVVMNEQMETLPREMDYIYTHTYIYKQKYKI